MTDPIRLCQKLWREVHSKKDPTGDYCLLATVDKKNHPHVRTVLIKTFDENGIGFVTNAHGRKIREIAHSAWAEGCLAWPSMNLQIRIFGKLKPMSKKLVHHFWKLRPREAQVLYHLGLEQSSLIPSFEFLVEKVRALDEKWKDKKIIPPSPNYIGFVLQPHWIEFLYHSRTRVNKRELFQKSKSGWKKSFLAP